MMCIKLLIILLSIDTLAVKQNKPANKQQQPTVKQNKPAFKQQQPTVKQHRPETTDDDDGQSLFGWHDIYKLWSNSSYQNPSKYEYDYNFWFDRVVGLSFRSDEFENRKGKITRLAPGVFINRDHILTSYNPIRHLVRWNVSREEVTVNILKYRRMVNFTADEIDKINETKWAWNYSLAFSNDPIVCGRPVVKGMHLMNLTFHGPYTAPYRLTSPTHDLAVLRLKYPVKFMTKKNDLTWKTNAIFEQDVEVGPLRTILADKSDTLEGKKIKFGAFGFDTNSTICQNLRSFYSMERAGNVIVDCNGYIPKEWGHFICVLHTSKYDFKCLGSGGPLYADDGKLYGIASFMFERSGEYSIFVFTDVRPYRELIFRTCLDPAKEVTALSKWKPQG